MKAVYGNQDVIIKCVYASCDSTKRRILWNDLSYAVPSCPWLIAGNFNIVCSQEEKLGGNPINIQDVHDFTHMLSMPGLSDAGYSGKYYTSSNNRVGKARILQRLDIVLLNTDWISSFVTCVTHLSKTCSDIPRYPLLIDVAVPNISASNFMFLNVWTKHHKFPQILKEAWDT